MQIRPEVPAPTAGQLPLPKAGVAAELYAFVPTFESMPYAAGHRPKAAVKHPREALDFKVGPGVEQNIHIKQHTSTEHTHQTVM